MPQTKPIIMITMKTIGLKPHIHNEQKTVLNRFPYNNDFIWTNNPSLLSSFKLNLGTTSMMLELSIRGLTENNYSVKVVGNLLVIILERKKDLIKDNQWGSALVSGNNGKYTLSIFERSDIFLPGVSKKKLKSVQFCNGALKIKLKLLPVHNLD
jgi:hypothetical protein